MNRRILFSRVFVMFFLCHELIIGCVYHSHTPESRLHLKYSFTKEILWSKIGYWFMYINDLFSCVNLANTNADHISFEEKDWWVISKWRKSRVVATIQYTVAVAARRRRRVAARCGAAAHRASVQVTSAEAVEAAEAGDFLVENASVSQPSFGQEIQSFSSWLCSFQSPSLYDLLFCDHEK